MLPYLVSNIYSCTRQTSRKSIHYICIVHVAVGMRLVCFWYSKCSSWNLIANAFLDSVFLPCERKNYCMTVTYNRNNGWVLKLIYWLSLCESEIVKYCLRIFHACSSPPLSFPVRREKSFCTSQGKWQMCTLKCELVYWSTIISAFENSWYVCTSW